MFLAQIGLNEGKSYRYDQPILKIEAIPKEDYPNHLKNCDIKPSNLAKKQDRWPSVTLIMSWDLKAA